MWNEDAKGFLHGCGKTPSCLKFTDRFWITSIFTLPLLILMIGMWAGLVSPSSQSLGKLSSDNADHVGSRSSFIKSAWASFKKHHSNMDTLVALGTLVAYVYSVFALLLVSQYTLRLRVLSSSLSS